MTKEDMKDAMYPGLEPSPFKCPYCADIGIVAYQDGSQGVCQQEGCEGAERVQTEITQMGDLLGAIDNLRNAIMIAPKNRELIFRHAKNLFEVSDKFTAKIDETSSGKPR